MKIIIRVDSSLLIGAGHVMRCLTLAEKLRDCLATVFFVCRNLNGNLVLLIKSKGFFVHILPEPIDKSKIRFDDTLPSDKWLGVSWMQDAKDTAKILKDISDIDLLVVDNYAIDFRWHQFLRSSVKKIMVIDDLADRRLDCNILLDQTYGRSDSDYRSLVSKQCKLLVGSKYSLLRPQFAKMQQVAVKRRSSIVGIRRILVSMGGGDPQDLTSIILKGLEQVLWPNDVSVDVILGRSSPNFAKVETLAGDSPLTVNLFSDVEDMEVFMVEADLSIGAGGTTSWERCCLGLPTIMVIVADNQQKVAEYLAAAGAAMNIGMATSLQPELITNSVMKLISQKRYYSKMVDCAFAITDGYGTRRVVSEVIAANNGVFLQQVTSQDCQLVYSWQSKQEIRQFCRNSAIPTLQDHQKWFAKVLKSNRRELFIIKFQNNAVGNVRLDKVEGKPMTIEVSILILPEWQRKGIGLKTLRAVRELRPDSILIAEILKENSRSIKLFQSAGFLKHEKTWYISRPLPKNVN